MISHLAVEERGVFVGMKGERVVVRANDTILIEVPLRRLKTISILRDGISLSSNLVQCCASRGIKLFFLDFSGRQVASLTGTHQHAVPAVRRNQFSYTANDNLCWSLARRIISGKIKNQRAVLLYFGKYLRKQDSSVASGLDKYASHLQGIVQGVTEYEQFPDSGWRHVLMGFEGAAANLYWSAIRTSFGLPESFLGREGRGASDIVNQCLNFAYAILESKVWHCIINAGLEPFVGFLHTDRPGKPSLVLDLMEEFRPWVADRTILKIRSEYSDKKELDSIIKRRIVHEIEQIFQSRHIYKDRRRLSLESILQRQIYALVGEFSGNKKYKSYTMKW